MNANSSPNIFHRIATAIGMGRALTALVLLALLALRGFDPWPVEALRLKVFDLASISDEFQDFALGVYEDRNCRTLPVPQS